MRAQTLADIRAERARLRAQNMVGYVPFHPQVTWNGHLYMRLQRAEDQLKEMPKGSFVALVHASGQLYYQDEGRSIGMVLTEGGRRHHVQVARHERRRILKRQASVHGRNRPMNWSGQRHPGYID